MQDKVFLKGKLKNVPVDEIDIFLNKLNNLSLSSIYSLTDEETDFIRQKLGVFNDGKTVSDKDLAISYNSSIGLIRLYENQLFMRLSKLLIEESERKLINKVNLLEQKRESLRLVDMVPEDYILLEELNLSDNINFIFKQNNIKTVHELCSYSFIDLLQMKWVNLDIINEVNKKLKLINYCLKNDYNEYSYQDLFELFKNNARYIRNYAHSLGIALKDEVPSDILPIESLDLSARSLKALTRSNIDCIGDLRNASEEEICQIRNLGKKSIFEIYDKLDEYNKKEENKEKKKVK